MQRLPPSHIRYRQTDENDDCTDHEPLAPGQRQNPMRPDEQPSSTLGESILSRVPHEDRRPSTEVTMLADAASR